MHRFLFAAGNKVAMFRSFYIADNFSPGRKNRNELRKIFLGGNRHEQMAEVDGGTASVFSSLPEPLPSIKHCIWVRPCEKIGGHGSNADSRIAVTRHGPGFSITAKKGGCKRPNALHSALFFDIVRIKWMEKGRGNREQQGRCFVLGNQPPFCRGK